MEGRGDASDAWGLLRGVEEEAPHRRLIVLYRLYAFKSYVIFPEELVILRFRKLSFRDPFVLTEI